MALWVPNTTAGIYQSGVGAGVAGLDLTSSFSISAWLKIRASSTGHYPIFSQGDCASGIKDVKFVLGSGGGFRLLTGGAGGEDLNTQSGGRVDAGQWRDYQFVCLTATATDLCFYQVSPGGMWSAHRQAFAGSTMPPTAPAARSTNVFSDSVTLTGGTIADLRVFKRELSASEARLVAEGQCNVGEVYRGYCLGSDGVDLSGTGNHIPSPTGTNVTRVPDPPHLSGGRIQGVFGRARRRAAKGVAVAVAPSAAPLWIFNPGW